MRREELVDLNAFATVAEEQSFTRAAAKLGTSQTQRVAWSVGEVARTLGILPGNARVISPYVGGGFGAKLFIRADAILAALGARAAGRPVKLALARPFLVNNTVHRPATIQRIRIGAGRDGKITAIAHARSTAA